jgi:hypothetical protein
MHAQILAEKAVREGLEELEMRFSAKLSKNKDQMLQACLISPHPFQRYIRALVGGRDYSLSQFNRCSQALRQPGSRSSARRGIDQPGVAVVVKANRRDIRQSPLKRRGCPWDHRQIGLIEAYLGWLGRAAGDTHLDRPIEARDFREITEQKTADQPVTVGGKDEAGVIGGGFRTSVPLAALANGVIAHALDYDDISTKFWLIPSVSLVPAILALAEKRRISGKAVLSSYIMGYETGANLGHIMGMTFFGRGWHASFDSINAELI